MPASNLCSASIPSEKDLQELEKHVEVLEQEKAVRSCTVILLRKDITAKLHLLDAQPQAQLEIQVIDDEDGFILSKDNIDELKAYLDRLKQLEEARRRELAGLLDQLALFFDRLDIPPEEQDRIRSSSNGLTPSTLAALRATLAEYERQKKERLREFVTRAKNDLLTWYKKCCVPQSRVYLDDDDSEDISEERLALLEEQLKALKEFYSENKVIIAKAERHDALWSRLLELEKLATDPSRLTNRGGRLLREAKERQRLQVEIPRLRKEIEKVIPTYSGSNKIFAVLGKDFLEHLDAQQQAHAQEKERERLERESRRKGTPSALGSSKTAYCGTPSSSASRMSQLGTSSGTLASSRRTGTPVRKATLAVRGGTSVGAAVRGIRRRSFKAQLRKEIEKFIATYSGSNEIFAVLGKDFLEHLDAQEQAHAQEKERERLARESRRKATPSALGSSKRAYCGTPSSSASRMSQLGTSSGALASSRRTGTPVRKATLAVRGGTSVGAAVRGIRRRSFKAQLRKEIEKFIATYSGSNEIFAVLGKDFLEHLDAQEQAHAQEKERERLARRRSGSSVASSNRDILVDGVQ
ncbi:protein regulator of cytokinesis 1-like [Rhipicephalus sanguineus]|uniref:protein regulator of cytokinesis 1-like n=1 Tax=Rhipicephalus sanguineus TaxID=34632 RepID=UPI0020C42574|nr:protein regulator of cytokinesis 1-like [Rhipicephalus sanguineus]